MSKFNVYSVFDRASETYNQPLCFVSDGVALRSLREALSDMSTIMAKYPDDYQLVKIGEFYVENGEFVSCRVVLVDNFRELLPLGGRAVGGDAPPEDAERPHAEGGHDFCDVSVSSDVDSRAHLSKAEKESKN